MPRGAYRMGHGPWDLLRGAGARCIMGQGRCPMGHGKCHVGNAAWGMPMGHDIQASPHGVWLMRHGPRGIGQCPIRHGAWGMAHVALVHGASPMMGHG